MPDPSAWVCNVCGYHAPVIPMARLCELAHQREAEQWAATANPDADPTPAHPQTTQQPPTPTP